MRIYDGSPRQDWEEVLRSIGNFADREHLKEISLLELDGGFLLQGLALPAGGKDSDSFGAVAKRTYELPDEQVAQLMDEATRQRGTDPSDIPQVDLGSFYEQALRIIGGYIDSRHARDVFFFEQDRSFVLRLLIVSQTSTRHELVEFTSDEIVAMIDAAPQQRESAPPSA
jgi:hypothetical protein